MEQVYKYLKKTISRDDKVIVAVSGGPDSVALFDLLINLKKDVNYTLICAHVNHNTGRIGQNEEEEYVKSLCKNNDIICEVFKINEYGDDNFENEARTKRYDFFDFLAKKYDAKYILTAHHGDDLVETIMMRMVRGSTLGGYGGFNKELILENYTILRPLIEKTKDEIFSYLDTNKIKYYIDYTNLENIHTRNRYRNVVLPFLKNEDKNVHLKFNKFSNLIKMYSDFVMKESKKIFNQVYVDNKLDIKKYNEQEQIIKLNIIYLLLENMYSDDLFLINDEHISLVNKLINSEKANSLIHLPNNIILTKKYNYIEISKSYMNMEEYEIEIIDKVILNNGNIIEVVEECKNDSNYVCRISKDDVLFPLYVRNRKDGDKIQVKNMNGSKKINDIFIDSKIDKEKRDSWPIVCDSEDNIIWLPGLKKSKFDKTKDEKYDIILKYQLKEEL